jgi:hypothetical protein
MKYHAIGYLIILAMLTGCAQFPVCPEIKLAICPAQGEK